MRASWPHGPFGVRLTSRTLPGEAVSSEDSLGGFGTRQDAEGMLEVGQRVLGLRRHHAPCVFSSPSPSLDGHPDGDRSPWSPGGLQTHLGSLSGLILPGGSQGHALAGSEATLTSCLTSNALSPSSSSYSWPLLA